MDYYRDSVTGKSWNFLISLQRQFQFVLIGGWAVWLYTKQLKSKDIDIVVGLSELEVLKSRYDVVKNERLKKYEFRSEEVSIDMYVPHYSSIGIPAEEILSEAQVVEGFRVPPREMLLTLKIVPWFSRRGSSKGQKDLLDIISLLDAGLLNSQKVKRWIEDTRLQQEIESLRSEIASVMTIQELQLNQHQVSRKKKQWMKILNFDLL